MSGLVLKLKAHEEVLVNGVLLCNGSRTTRLVVKTPDARILRLSEAISEAEADTAVARLCLLAQQVVSGERALDATLQPLADGISELELADLTDQERTLQIRTLDALRDRNVYTAFRALKKMMALGPDARGTQPVSGRSSGSTGSGDAIR